MQQPYQQKKRKSGSNWIGLVIFLLIIAGRPILNVVSNIVASISNNTVTLPANILPLLIGGFVLLATVIALVQKARGMTEGSRSQWPTPPPAPPFEAPGPRSDTFRSAQPVSSSSQTRTSPYANQPGLPASMYQKSINRGDMGAQKLPRAPRFEPVVDARVVLFGILGLLFFAIVFGGLFLFWFVQIP